MIEKERQKEGDQERVKQKYRKNKKTCTVNRDCETE